MQITSIEQVRRGRCRIWINDEPAFCLTPGEAEELALFEGGTIEEDQLEMLIKTFLTKKACRRAVDVLSVRDKTCAQMRELLKKEEFPPEAVEGAMQYLMQHHYVDDLRYACTYLSLRQGKDSRLRLTQQLMQRGISKEIIDLAFEEEGEGDQEALIMDLLRKKHYSPDAGEKEREKVIRYLAGRGFSYDQIKKALTSFS